MTTRIHLKWQREKGKNVYRIFGVNKINLTHMHASRKKNHDVNFHWVLGIYRCVLLLFQATDKDSGVFGQVVRYQILDSSNTSVFPILCSDLIFPWVFGHSVFWICLPSIAYMSVTFLKLRRFVGVLSFNVPVQINKQT